jgi:hypothetical protein
MESSASLVAVAAFMLIAPVGKKPSPAAPHGSWRAVATGLCLGLAMLARIDNLVLLAPILLLAGPSTLRPLFIATVGVCAAMVLSPWLLWNVFTFGSVVQTSAIAKTVALKGGALGTIYGGPWGWLSAGATILWAALAARPELVVWLGFWVAFAGLEFVKRGPAGDAFGPTTGPIHAFNAGFLVLLVVHASVRWHLQEWYLAPATVAIAMLAAALLGQRVRSPPGYAALGLTLAALCVFSLPPWISQRRALAGNVSYYRAARWLEAHSLQGRVAGFNSGILSYFSGKAVQNLDGVVSARALEALRSRSLVALMRREGIRWILDDPWSVEHEYASFYGPGGARPAFVLVKRLDSLALFELPPDRSGTGL